MWSYISKEKPEKMSLEEFIDYVDNHKSEFIYYCEIIIDNEGNIYRLQGSHQTMLIRLFAEKSNITLEELKEIVANSKELRTCAIDKIAEERFSLISVWYDFIEIGSDINQIQQNVLDELSNRNIINKNYTINRTKEYSNYLKRCKLSFEVPEI